MATLDVPSRSILEDEWNIDFDDTRGFVLESWRAAIFAHPLSKAEQKQTVEFINAKSCTDYALKEQLEARKQGHLWKSSGLTSVLEFIRHLSAFETMLQDLCDAVQDRDSDNSEAVIVMEGLETASLWQLLHLNIKLSTSSKEKYKKTSKWMKDMRHSLDKFETTVRQATHQKTISENAIRMELLEVFEPLMGILRESVNYLQRHFNDDEFEREWMRFYESKIKDNLSSIDSTERHLRDLSSSSRLDQPQSKVFISELAIRDRVLPTDGSEKAIFPLEMLPQFHTEHFIGRVKDIEKIHSCLSPAEAQKLRKYHIYGRRGVGKTQLALEYCRQHKDAFDAIFWIQCETKASLRQSFANIATKLELVSENVIVDFSEALIRVLRWLRQTQKKWLLIYDNAERSNVLKGFYPSGAQGSMLLTSRSYYNFFEDEIRQGETVEVFDHDERRQLLLTLLGRPWQAEHLGDDEMLAKIEQAAIDTLLEETGGLPITIHQATKLIKDGTINAGQTVRRFMDTFRQRWLNLPRRLASERDPLIRALDTVWSISFDTLSSNAKTILQCISFLAPDRILTDLFLPGDQSLLPECLAFCRTPVGVKGGSGKPLQVQIDTLDKTFKELEQKGLIRINGRALSIHRTIQEAVIFEDKSELQTRFEATTCLLYDAFPKQDKGRPLQDSWQWCREWILHAIQLSVKYRKYNTDGAADDLPLKGQKATEMCARLFANCAWYLYEIADYEAALDIVEVARNAIYDKRSLLFAHVTNTEGAAHYDLNNLGPSKAAFDTSLDIRVEKLGKAANTEIAGVMANLGNVETAQGEYVSALNYLEQTVDMRLKLGREEEVYLALTYLQIGRVYLLQDKTTEAYQMLRQAEQTLNPRRERNKLFMGHVHYDFGNYELKQGNLDQAAVSFNRALAFAQSQGPLLPLTASSYYKLGVVELGRNHHNKALNYLNKSLDIAETRNPGELDGGVVRVQFKISEVLLDDPLGDRERGLRLRQDCERHRNMLADKLRIAMPAFDDSQDIEKSFDLLVPGFFR